MIGRRISNNIRYIVSRNRTTRKLGWGSNIWPNAHFWPVLTFRISMHGELLLMADYEKGTNVIIVNSL